MIGAATEIAWLTPAAVLGLAGVIVRIAVGYRAEMKDARAEQKSLFEAQLESQKEETRHRESLLEKVLVVLQEHNSVSQRTLFLIKEIRDLSGEKTRRPSQDGEGGPGA